MKQKILMLTFLAMGLSQTLSAQNGGGRRNFDPAEMAERGANRLAKDMDLKDEAKDNFVSLYKEYMTERVKAQRQGDDDTNARRRGEIDYDNLSAEEAKNMVNKRFEQQQALLDVEKTYYKKFSEMLTPQQVARVFTQQRTGGDRNPGGRSDNGGQRGGFGGPGGGFGGQGGPGGGF